jgi:UDP-glucose 4-epimerase
MKALVTGGAGFIGSNIVKLLIEQGHRVAVLDNLSTGYKSNLSHCPTVDFIKGDVRDLSAVSRAAEKAEVIFHLAASVGNARSLTNPIEDSEINVIGTLRILEAARHGGVRKVVVSSSAGIFGELKTLPICEHHPLEPETPYGVSKLAEEKMSLAYSKLYGFEVACLRYFNVYGVNQRYDAYGNVIPIFVHRSLEDQPMIIFGDGEQTRDFVNVRDVARANLAAAEKIGAAGAFNLASGTSITINELAKMIRLESGSKARIEYGPLRKGDVRDSLADISAAHAAFGYQPTVQLAEGLKEYVQWVRQELTLNREKAAATSGKGATTNR